MATSRIRKRWIKRQRGIVASKEGLFGSLLLNGKRFI
jgi:hypothetical protein